MTRDQTTDPLCARVFDRLAEGSDVGGEPELATHVGSCMACFRAMSELRDAPRLAAILRADPPPPLADGSGSPAAVLARSLSDDEAGDVTDVTDLDGAALRRLVERLRAGPPGKLTAPVAADPVEAAEVLADDDERVNDMLVDLDGPALLRLERSLARPSL